MKHTIIVTTNTLDDEAIRRVLDNHRDIIKKVMGISPVTLGDGTGNKTATSHSVMLQEIAAKKS